MKKLSVFAVFVLICALVLSACGTSSYSSTTTTTTTADGKTTTTTTTTSTSNGETVTEERSFETYSDVPTTINNITDFDIIQLYCKNANSDDWGTEIIKAMFGEGERLAVNERFSNSFSFESDNSVFDFRIIDEDGAYIDFSLDFKEVAGKEQYDIFFDGNEETGYACYFGGEA